MLPKPNLILCSGSVSSLDETRFEKYDCPSIFSLEYNEKKKLPSSPLKCCSYRHYLNGGYTKARVSIGFLNTKALSKLSSISKTIGDFIEYSHQPWKICSPQLKNSKVATSSSIVGVKDLHEEIFLPSYKFATGWGCRFLSKKEACLILGWDILEVSSIRKECIVSLNPIQSLSLVVQSLIKNKKNHELTNVKQKAPQFVPIEEETFFQWK